MASTWSRSSYIVGVDFRMDAPGHSRSLASHATKQVRVPKDGEAMLPLKNHYGLVKFTLEGVSGRAPSEPVGFDLPNYDGGDPYQSGVDPRSLARGVGAIPRMAEVLRLPARSPSTSA